MDKDISNLRVQIVSDLHLEFSHIELHCENADVLILAGDIHSDIGKLRRYIINILKKYKDLHIVIVAGNHEYYSSKAGKSVPETVERLRLFLNIHDSLISMPGENNDIIPNPGEISTANSQPSPRCHFLENDMVIIRGVKFIGCTLWCDPPARYHSQIRNGISDFLRIKGHTIENCINYQQDSLQYILENADCHSVVITHFAPSFSSIHEKYRNDKDMIPLNYYYFTDLEEHIRDLKPKIWVHGHVHNSFSYYIGDTRVICNPRGYSQVYNEHSQNPSFDRNLIVQI